MRNIMKSYWLVTVVLVTILAVVAGCAVPTTPTEPTEPSEEVIKWRMQSWSGSGTPTMDEYTPEFVEAIATMSQGRLQIEFFGLGEIVGALEMLESTGSGLLDICQSSPCYEDGVWPGAPVAYGLPFSFQNSREVDTWMEYLGVIDYLNEVVYHPLNVHVISHFINPPVRLGTKVPINSLEDISGLKIRAVGGAAYIWEKLGAAVTYIPYPEVYLAVATGVIDGQSMGGFEEQWAVKMHEVEGYWLNVAVQPQSGFIYVNMDSWNALSDDLKEIVRVASRYLHIITNNRMLYDDSKGWQEMAASGATLTTLSKADMDRLYEVAGEVWDDIAAKDAVAAELIRRAKDYMRFLGYMK